MEGGVRTLRLFATASSSPPALLLSASRPASACRCAEPQAFVSIALTSIEPALPTPTGTVTLKGNGHQHQSSVLSNLQAIFWRAPNVPLLNTEALNRSLTWPATSRWASGSRTTTRTFLPRPTEPSRLASPRLHRAGHHGRARASRWRTASTWSGFTSVVAQRSMAPTSPSDGPGSSVPSRRPSPPTRCR